MAAALVLALVSGCVRTPAAPETPEGVTYRVRRAPEGGVYIYLTQAQLEAAGLAVGDSVDVTLRGDLTLEGVPFYSRDYASPDQSCLLPAPAEAEGEGLGPALLLRAPAGQDLWELAGLRDFRRVRLALREKGAYLYEERARAFYRQWSASADTGGFALGSYEERQNVRYLVTSFTAFAGVYDAAGVLQPEGAGHSQLIPVRPGAYVYLGFRDPETAVAGAFFNDAGDWVAPVAADAVEPYDYRVPNAIAGTWRFEDRSGGAYVYPVLYAVRAPENAAYVSFNLTEKPEYAYRQFAASFPVFALADTGNMIWQEDDPACQATKEKRLCLIGQSNIMIDRCLRPTHPGEAAAWRFIASFQEYLVPWFGAVDSYGYSGKGYMRNGADGVWDYVIGRGLDLSGYDIFLITAGRNALTLGKLGDVTSRDPATYCGAVNALIDYVRSQYAADAQPEICLSTVHILSSVRASADALNLALTLNERVRALAAERGCTLIDYGADIADTLAQHESEMFYDGKHANELGGRLLGEYYRKQLVGF